MAGRNTDIMEAFPRQAKCIVLLWMLPNALNYCPHDYPLHQSLCAYAEGRWFPVSVRFTRAPFHVSVMHVRDVC